MSLFGNYCFLRKSKKSLSRAVLKKISCCPIKPLMFLMHSSLIAFQHQYSNTKGAATIKSRSSELNCQLPGRIRFLAIYSTVKKHTRILK